MVAALVLMAGGGGLRASFLRAEAPARVGDIALDRASSSALDRHRPLRIGVLGTSLTHSYSWPEVVADDLRDRLGRDVQLIRLAKPGASSAWGRSAAAADPELTGVDIVLVEFLANDADSLELMTVARSRQNHRDIIESLRARSRSAEPPAIVLMTMNPSHGARAVLRARMPSFEAMYSDLARRQGVGLLNLRSRWSAAERFGDGLHPTNDQANAVIPSAVVGYLFG